MSIEPATMMINNVKYVREDSVKTLPVQHSNVVLVRCDRAGVHVGELVSQETGGKVVLKNATRVWRWKGANTVSELSQKGGDQIWTRISEPVVEITLFDAVEVIKCSVEGAKNLLTSRWPV